MKSGITLAGILLRVWILPSITAPFSMHWVPSLWWRVCLSLSVLSFSQCSTYTHAASLWWWCGVTVTSSNISTARTIAAICICRLIYWEHFSTRKVNTFFWDPNLSIAIYTFMHLDWNLLASGLLKQAASGWMVVKVLIRQRRKRTWRTAISLRGGISEAVANPRRRCRFSVFRSYP